jgi:hypothetical protein
MNRGDYTRFTHKPFKHYTGVLKQQGRVDLDAESIEADEIAAHLRQTQTQDVIGLCGFPETGGGFGISSTQPRLMHGGIDADLIKDVDLTISAGRGYVDGILCESEAEFVPISKVLTDSGTQVHRAKVPTLIVDGRELQRGQWVEISTVGFLVQPRIARITRVDVRNLILEFDVDISEFGDKPSQLRRVTTYTTQPDYPNPTGLDLEDLDPNESRTDLVYLDVWQRHITAIEDPNILEVALGGPDTTTRVKTVWQVKVLKGVRAAIWEDIGPAVRVAAMAAINDKLFAAIRDNRLWWRDPVGFEVNWERIGDAIDGADEVVAMAAINNKLFAATRDKRLWWRDPVDIEDVIWEEIGSAIDQVGADEVVAMAAINDKLFAATRDNRLWWRDAVGFEDVIWEEIGHANNVVAMAAINNKLFAASRNNRLWWRDPVGFEVNWEHIGDAIDGADEVVAMAAINDKLFAASRNNRLWWRDAVDIEVNCEDEITGWPPSTSGGRLSTEVVPTPAAEDPCLLAPGGGYRGLENRLYRVEIHRGGELGEATFKWSRDNGSVVFPIEEFVSDRKVKVRRVGQDQVLRLRTDDWVEILDDDIEYRQDHTQEGEIAGTMAQIVSPIDEENRLLTLDRDIPASIYSVARHARIRRWDQTQNVDDEGLITTATGPISLEDGIQARFSGDNFKVGDCWDFAARTATGDVERLTDAPPRGIKHHYCRLALVRWTVFEDDVFDSGLGLRMTVDDCRRIFPPLTEIPTPLAWPTIERINWGNDREMPLEQFNNRGLSILFSEPINQAALSLDTFIVTLEPPLNFRNLWGHFSFIVHGEVTLQGDSMCLFRPDPIDRETLAELIGIEQEIFNSNRIRCRVMLKGNAILSETDELPLDGDVFGQLRNDTDPDTNQPTTDLILPSGDGNKGGDFESWFYLVSDREAPPLRLDLRLEPSSVVRGSPSIGTITLSDPAPQDGAEVLLDSSRTDIATVPLSVTFSRGQSTSEFTVETFQDAPVGLRTEVIITARASFAEASDSAVLVVEAPPLRLDLEFNPTTLVAPTLTSRGTITMTPAPSNDAEVDLVADKPNLVPGLPTPVTISGGQNSTTFDVRAARPTTSFSDTATIKATFAEASDTAELHVVIIP